MPKKVGDGATCHQDVPDPSCKRCAHRLYMRAWSKENKATAQRHGRKSALLRREDPKKHAKDKARSRAWRLEHPREMADAKLRYYHGISLETYEHMLEAQEYRCAICFTDTPRGTGRFHVDHDHDTGKIRGLLCSPCNITLRFLAQRLETRERVQEYMQRGKL